MTQPKRVTKAHPDECPTCQGIGYRRQEGTEYEITEKGNYRSLTPGSGCPRCGGTGRLDHAADVR